MRITVGTFNLNNLFSRFNFQGVIEEFAASRGPAGALTLRYEFTDPRHFRVRTFDGRLVERKDPDDTAAVAARIRAMDLDVLAVQEVEHIDILRQFNRRHLDGLYSTEILVEGNDPRFIDVGVLSKLPLGGVTSHQTAVHPVAPDERVFGRDLLELEILHSPGGRRLFTLFNTHLKSRFVPFDQDQAVGGAEADARRRRQAETIRDIVAARMRPNSSYVILGDMNDAPDADTLAPLREIEGRAVANALAAPRETRPAKAESSGNGPATTAWTHRHKASGEAPEHLLFDQIWLSHPLAARQTDAVIDRRTKHGGDGSDHDPAWVELDF